MAQRKEDLYSLPPQTGPNKGVEPSVNEVDWSSAKWGCKIPQLPTFQLALEADCKNLNFHPPLSISEVKEVSAPCIELCCRPLSLQSLPPAGSWVPMQEWGEVRLCLAFSWNVLINGVKRGNKFASAALCFLPPSNQHVLPGVAISPCPYVLIKTLDSIRWGKTYVKPLHCVNHFAVSVYILETYYKTSNIHSKMYF